MFESEQQLMHDGLAFIKTLWNYTERPTAQ
jgi:hypothetical protein